MFAKSLVKSSAWNLIGQGAPILFALITVPLLLKTIGEARYGFLTVVWVLIGYLGLFDFGVGKAMTRVVAERLGQGDRVGAGVVAKAALMMMLGIGLLSATGFLVFADFIVGRLALPPALHQEGVNAMRILALGLPFVMLTSGYRGCLEACNQFGPLNIVRVGMGLFTYLAPLAAVLWSPRLEFLVAAVVAMRVVANVVHRLLYQRYCSFELATGVPDQWRVELRKLLGFGGWMTVSNIISPMMNSLDRLIIGTIVPVAAVGYYATAYDMISKVLMLPYSITGAAFPAMAGMADDGQVRRVYAGMFKFMAILVLPVLAGAALLADVGFHAWLGQRFAQEAAPALKILAVGLLFNCVAQVPATLILTRGSPRWMALCHVVEAPCYLGLVMFLTTKWGIQGTALAWAIRAAVDAMLLAYLAQRKLVRGALTPPLLIIIMVLAVMMFAPAFATGPLTWRLLGFLAALAASGVIVWRHLLTAAERPQLLAALQRRKEGWT